MWGAAGYRDTDNQRVLCHGLGRRGQAKRERGGKERKGRQGEKGEARRERGIEESSERAAIPFLPPHPGP